jgi:hypothetical protein
MQKSEAAHSRRLLCEGYLRPREFRIKSRGRNHHLLVTPEAYERRLTNELAAQLMDSSIVLQPCDFVLHQQLATLQRHDLKIIDRWMGTGFADFCFQGPVPSLQFRKMGFYGHVRGFSSASCTTANATPLRPAFEASFHCAVHQSPL